MNKEYNDINYVFVTRDANGTLVGLKDSTWKYKLEPSRGSDINPDHIKLTIEEAHRVNYDPEHSQDSSKPRRIYYRFDGHPIAEKNHLVMFKVVVEENTKTGVDEVVTAHFMSNLRGESSRGAVIYDAGTANRHTSHI